MYWSLEGSITQFHSANAKKWEMSLGGKGVEMSDKLFATCESENCAIMIGIGRGNGETFQILENGSIYYSGFEFKRMEK